ncbi:hypothetical protein [Actinoplanes xinjiangensis]|uniref:hypothetical protein n=1 Tax=Actinoplanes xinjiangensis TaxID=512350 RepID=UPI003444821B
MGRSTAVRRMLLSPVAQGVTPLTLGDLKPDYAELVAALVGQIAGGPGHNPGRSQAANAAAHCSSPNSPTR